MILADENIPFEITKSLRKEGFEVTSIYETARGIKDEQIIEMALKYDFLLLTEDKDFGELVFRLQMPHSGILLIKIEEAQQKIPLVVETVTRNLQEMIGKFSVIDGNKLRIKE